MGDNGASVNATGGSGARLPSRVMKGMVTVGSGGLLSSGLGLCRQIIFAWIYGAGKQMDAYLVASVVVQVVFTSLDRAVFATFMPEYIRLKEVSEHEADAFLQSLSTLIVVGFAALAVLVWLVAPELIRAVAPGFRGAEAYEAAALLRVMVPCVVCMGLASVYAGYLQTNDRFGPPAVMFVGRNVLLIVGAALLGRRFGSVVLAWCWLAGAAVQLLAVAVPARRLGRSLRLSWRVQHAGIRRMVVRMSAVFGDIVVSQLGVLVERVLASGLPVGSVSALAYAQALITQPLGLMSSVGTALFPSIAVMAAANDHELIRDVVRRSLRILALFAIPVALCALLFRTAVVEMVYSHGSFGPHALAVTSECVAFDSVGIVSMAWNYVLGRTLLALQDTRALMVCASWSVVVATVVDLLLIGSLRQGALALGMSIGACANTVALLLVVNRRVRGIGIGSLLWFVGVEGVTGAVCYGAAAWLGSGWGIASLTHSIAVRGMGLAACVACGSVLFYLCQMWNVSGREVLQDIGIVLPWRVGSHVASRVCGK